MATGASREKHYLPATGVHFLLPIYDVLTKWMGMERPRLRMIELTELREGETVLDVGCGTGTLAIAIKRAAPGAHLNGIDPDPAALSRGAQKAKAVGVAIHFDRGFAGELPYPDGSFDHIFSSFMFHHLPTEEKERMLREVLRVLNRSGRFHLLDFNGEGHGFLARIAHSHQVMRENSEERVLGLMYATGFNNAKTVGRDRSIFGEMAYYEARK